MSRHERRHSRSDSLEADTRPTRRNNGDSSLYERDDRSKSDKIRRQHRHRSQSRSRSRSPRREHRRSRRKRSPLSPSSDRSGNDVRQRDRWKYRDRSPVHTEPRHRRTRKRPRSRSRSPLRLRTRSRSRSPTKSKSGTATALQRSRGPLPSQNQAFSREKQALVPNSSSDATAPAPVPEKQKPNFNVTGKLAAASNTVQTAGQTIVLKYHEPAEARKPPSRDAWRMYIFKDDEIVDTVELWEQSCWLFGREIAVADIPTEHPSCSGQHAVLQFRYVEKRNEFGDKIGKVKPYVLDLESVHGTWLNNDQVEQSRYLELRDGDMLRFGRSGREYVIQLPKNK